MSLADFILVAAVVLVAREIADELGAGSHLSTLCGLVAGLAFALVLP